MGGKGSGGARVGAGRKPKSDATRVRQGTATLEQRAAAAEEQAPTVQAPGPSTGGTLPPGLEPPAGCPEEQAAVWHALAPHAIAARTLTPATALSFGDLCEVICVKRDLRTRIAGGYEVETDLGTKAHPLLTHYRTILQRVEAGLARFKLAPIGKDFDEPGAKPPVDPFDEFDAPATQLTAAH